MGIVNAMLEVDLAKVGSNNTFIVSTNITANINGTQNGTDVNFVNINASLLNATSIFGNYTGNVQCDKITGSPDADFCADADSGGGGGITNGTDASLKKLNVSNMTAQFYNIKDLPMVTTDGQNVSYWSGNIFSWYTTDNVERMRLTPQNSPTGSLDIKNASLNIFAARLNVIGTPEPLTGRNISNITTSGIIGDHVSGNPRCIYVGTLTNTSCTSTISPPDLVTIDKPDLGRVNLTKTGKNTFFFRHNNQSIEDQIFIALGFACVPLLPCGAGAGVGISAYNWSSTPNATVTIHLVNGTNHTVFIGQNDFTNNSLKLFVDTDGATYYDANLTSIKQDSSNLNPEFYTRGDAVVLGDLTIGSSTVKIKPEGTINVSSNITTSRYCIEASCIDSWDDVNVSLGSFLTNNSDVNYGRINASNLSVSGNISLGNSEGDHCIFFYKSGNPSEESLCWTNQTDRWIFSDSVYVNSLLTAATMQSSGNIYTISAGADLWLGTLTQKAASFQAYADGRLNTSNNTWLAGHAVNISMQGDVNATKFYGNFTGNISCDKITGSDDFCVDATGGGGFNDSNLIAGIIQNITDTRASIDDNITKARSEIRDNVTATRASTINNKTFIELEMWKMSNFTTAFNNIYNLTDSELLKNNTDVYFTGVGIGTSTPENALVVVGTANISTNLIVQSDGGGTYDDPDVFIGSTGTGGIRIGKKNTDDGSQIYTDGNHALVIRAELNPDADPYTMFIVQSSGNAKRLQVIQGKTGFANTFYDSLAVGAAGDTSPTVSSVDLGAGAAGDLWVADGIELEGDLAVDGGDITGAGLTAIDMGEAVSDEITLFVGDGAVGDEAITFYDGGGDIYLQSDTGSIVIDDATFMLNSLQIQAGTLQLESANGGLCVDDDTACPGATAGDVVIADGGVCIASDGDCTEPADGSLCVYGGDCSILDDYDAFFEDIYYDSATEYSVEYNDSKWGDPLQWFNYSGKLTGSGSVNSSNEPPFILIEKKNFIGTDVGMERKWLRASIKKLVDEGFPRTGKNYNDTELRNRIEGLEADNDNLRARVELLEALLNVTTEPPITPLYKCSTRGDEECPGGLSAVNKYGLQTRCYNPFKIGWKRCDTGWFLA